MSKSIFEEVGEKAGAAEAAPTGAEAVRERDRNRVRWWLIILAVMVVVLVVVISFVERAQRRLLIQYPKRATQRGVMPEFAA